MERAFYDGTRGFSQSYLLSRIVRNAQRSTKVPFFIREIGVNTLRWPKSFSVILQITGPAPFSATLRSLPKYHHQDYHPEDLFLAHLFAIVTGIGRIENTQALIHNGLIPPLLGLPEFPHRDTLRSFLWRFGPNELHALVAAHDRLRQELFFRLGLRYSAIIDADTTALITYGSQEGTAVGYVPKRRHSQPSYAPIISSENRFEFGHGTQSRQCARFLWSLGFPQASPGQIAFLDRFHAHTGASRWSFLRQKHRPVSRYKAARLWHCGSNVPTVEKPYGRSSIPRVCSRLGSRSVLLHAASVERRTQVCGRAQAHRF